MAMWFKKYRWAFMLFIFVLVLTFGIILFINPEQFGTKTSCFLTGMLVVFFGLIRLFPLVKSLKGQKARIIINSIEMVVDIAIGALLIAFAFNADLLAKYVFLYKYLVAFVLYARGTIYFVETTFLKGEAEPTKFVVSLGCITIGSVMVALENFDQDWLRIFFASACMVLALYSLIDASINFCNYRKLYMKPKVKVIEVKKEGKVVEENKEAELQDAEIKTIDEQPKEVKQEEKESVNEEQL